MINIEYFANKTKAEREAVPAPPPQGKPSQTCNGNSRALPDAAVARIEAVALVKTGHGIVLDLGGPTMELLTSVEQDAYCVMKGTLPAGVIVPLHSHGDGESFHILSGEAEVLAQTPSGLKWKTLRSGDFAHIPGGVKHAWRNLSANPVEVLCATTPKLGRFLSKVGEFRAAGGDRMFEELRRLSISYGYWMGSPKENAEVGISLQ